MSIRPPISGMILLQKVLKNAYLRTTLSSFLPRELRCHDTSGPIPLSHWDVDSWEDCKHHQELPGCRRSVIVSLIALQNLSRVCTPTICVKTALAGSKINIFPFLAPYPFPIILTCTYEVIPEFTFV